MGMELELPSIQLKVMSCTDLKAFNFFHKLSVYVVVSILHDDPQNNKKPMLLQQRQKTGMDRDGEWNQLMHFDLKPISLLDCTHVYLKFQLRCQRIIHGNKTIGEVWVPLEDLIHESSSGGGGHGDVRFVSYQVRTTNGKPNGVLNFSYKVIHNVTKAGTGNDPHPPPAEMERVRYPSQEDYKIRTGSHPPALETERIRYPSLEDIYPSPNDVDVDVDVYCPSPAVSFYNYQKPEFHCTPPRVAAGTLYYSPPPGPYKYVLESRGYEYDDCGTSGWRLPIAGYGSSTSR